MLQLKVKLLTTLLFISFNCSSINAKMNSMDYIKVMKEDPATHIFMKEFSKNKAEYLKKLNKALQIQGISSKGFETVQTITFSILQGKLNLTKYDMDKLLSVSSDTEVSKVMRSRASLLLYAFTGEKEHIFNSLDLDPSVIMTFSKIRDDNFKDIFTHFLLLYRNIVLQTKDYKIPEIINDNQKRYRIYGALRHDIDQVFISLKFQKVDFFYIRYFLLECEQFDLLTNLSKEQIIKIGSTLRAIPDYGKKLLELYLKGLSSEQRKIYIEGSKTK